MRRIRGYRTLIPVLMASGILASAVPAGAAVTIGQLAPTPPAIDACAGSGSGSDYLQPSVTGGTLYSARAAGTITSWSTNASISSMGAEYVFKVFRRTSDPDAFQVVGRATEHILSGGLNTVSTALQVESGDLIGLHEEGAGQNSCTFEVPGDGALQSPGDLGSGQSAQFVPVPNVRLNLSAVLIPSNAFTILSIARHRRNGTATLTLEVSNPGVVAIGGRGLKRKSATPELATRVILRAKTVGKTKRKLARRGKLKVPVTLIFHPTGGDPSVQTVILKLVQRRAPSSV